MIVFLSTLLSFAQAEELTFATNQALAVHLPTGGLDQIGVALRNVLPSSINVASGANSIDCSSTSTVTYAIDELDLIFAIDDVEFITQDGYLDLIFVSHVSGPTNNYSYNTTSYIYYGSASGYSTYNRDSLQSYGSLGGEVADLNFDGYPDLVLGNYINASGNYAVESYIYWGGSNGYGGNRTSLAIGGVWDKPLIVGNVQ